MTTSRTDRSSNSDMTIERCGRKRSFPSSNLLLASAMAISMTSACAFQTNSHVAFSNINQRRNAMALCVVTDPKQLIQMEFPGNDRSERRSLEDIFLITSEQEGLSGDLVEGLPRRRQSVRGIKAGNTMTYDEVDLEEKSSKRIQFKGLSTTPKPRARKGRSLSRVSPELRNRKLIEGTSDYAKKSKSSTMPGFRERSSTDRQIAFDKGIKLAEERTGKKYIDSNEAKEQRRQRNGENMYKSSVAVPESMLQFANEIHDIERITPKEEKILGQKTQAAIRLQKIYDGLANKLDREPTDEEWCAASGKINMEAISQTIEEGIDAKNKLVTSNLRMVQGVVNVYIRNGLRGQYNAGDLMQEGIMALIRAAEKFDPNRGFRFSTYAMYWIRSAIKRNQIFQSRVVSIPQRLHENHKRIIRVRSELMESLGRTPTKTELSQAVGMTEFQMDRCIDAMTQRCYSLDQELANPLKPNSGDGAGTMYELVASKSEDSDGDVDSMKHVFLREDLIETLRRHLTEEEAMLLLLRYGLDDSAPQNLKNGPLTIAEVSRMVGLKPDKVRRMLNRSLKHLKVVIGKEWSDYERELN